MSSPPTSELFPPEGTCAWCHHSAYYHIPKIDQETGKTRYPCIGISSGCGRYGAGCSDFRTWPEGVPHP